MQKRATTYVSYGSLAEVKERKDTNNNWLRKNLNDKKNFAQSKAMTHRAEHAKPTNAQAVAAPGEEQQFDMSTPEGIKAYKAQLLAELHSVNEALGETDTTITLTKVSATAGKKKPAVKKPAAKKAPAKAAAKKATKRKPTKKK